MPCEYNATMSDLKEGDFFKVYPEDSVNIVIDKSDTQVRCFDLEEATACKYRLMKDVPVIIIPRKKVIKKSVRRGR